MQRRGVTRGCLWPLRVGGVLLAVLVAVAMDARVLAAAQSPGAQSGVGERATTLARVTALRDRFVAQLKMDGFTCPIAPPKILVEDVPSMGQYDDETNTLRTADWTLLNPGEKAFMRQLAGPDASEAEMRVVFEKAAHQWIFMHELGHWWQACRGFTLTHSHYAVESGANRMALAYWRENDPSVVTLMMRLFHQVLDHTPSPVPAGESVETFFDKNYETLGPSPSYPWFQSQMNVTLEGEMPVPSLKKVLAETKP